MADSLSLFTTLGSAPASSKVLTLSMFPCLVAASMMEEIAKPMKVFSEIQHRTRKATEALVEKRHRGLQEWRQTEAKAKAK